MKRPVRLDVRRVEHLFAPDTEYGPFAGGVAAIALALCKLAESGETASLVHESPVLMEKLSRSIAERDVDDVLEALLQLYARFHEAGEGYTAEERGRLDASRGYICYAGGLSPLLRAKPYLRTHSVSIDLGAGNGLQGLLLQRLYPHSKTIQVELSSQLVRTGRTLQRVLEIPEDRVEWRVSDIADVTFDGIDFVYLYRPVRPVAAGRALYERIARRLEACRDDTVVFSVADCLGPFLDERFSCFFSDSHLTCYKKKTQQSRPEVGGD